MNLRKAERLYGLAASSDLGTVSIYMPPSAGAAHGRVVTAASGRPHEGLPEATLALAALRLRSARSNKDRAYACRLARKAEVDGAADAVTILRMFVRGRQLRSYC